MSFFHNGFRSHSSLDNLTPNEVHEKSKNKLVISTYSMTEYEGGINVIESVVNGGVYLDGSLHSLSSGRFKDTFFPLCDMYTSYQKPYGKYYFTK